MATVNFQCGHCHNLMAVGQEFLGQQVRCPHCQQVVLAPPPAPALTPPPEPPPFLPAAVSGPEEHDSIFTPPEEVQEDLFGAGATPHVELPTEPAFPQMALDEPTFPGESGASPRVTAPDDRTVTYPGSEVPPLSPATEVLPPEGVEVPAASDGVPPAPSDESLSLPVMHKPRVPRSNPWIIPLFIAPLIFYSVMATLYILDMQFFHFFSPPPPPNSLEILPDIEGDNAGAAKHGGKRSSRRTRWDDPLSPLAEKLRVRLGGTLAIGDLEVTPLKVERKRISYAIGKTKEPATEDSLAVYLRLRNRSQDVVFKPMDRFFARSRPTGLEAIPQYTVLEMGDRKFFGGPLTWISLAAAKKPDSHANIEYVDQQVVNKELSPGEEMETFVCTNPNDKAAKALDGYQGPLLWRVQLRRGLVKWTTKTGVPREDSATTVVGVEFTSADVGKSSG